MKHACQRIALSLCVAAATGALLTGCSTPGSSRQSWEDVVGNVENSPGVELVMRETKRERMSGYTKIEYKLVANGFAAGELCDVWLYDMGMRLDGSPPALIPRDQDPNQVHYVIEKFQAGEWSEFCVVSKDKSKKGFVRIVPFPIEATDGRARLWLEPFEPGKVFAVFVEGFVPGETVSTTSKSGDEVLEGTAKIGPNGRTVNLTLLAPANAAGKFDASYRVKGKNSDLTVRYQWGPPGRAWR